MNVFRHLLNLVTNRWNRSIRYQLVVSFSLVTLTVVLMSSYALFSYQRNFLYEQSINSTASLAKTLSYSSSSWVVANDVVGLQEVLQGASSSEDLKFALVLSPRGKVIASTKSEYIGQFFDDALSLSILNLEPTTHILLNTSNLIDVVVPIRANKQLVGWIRVERTRDTLNDNLIQVVTAGLAITLLLILMISALASVLAKRLTSGLYRLLNVATEAELGNEFLRIDLDRKDELGVLARHLYQAFDTINAEKKKSVESETKIYSLLRNVHTGVVVHDSEGRIIISNLLAQELLGLSEDQINGKMPQDPQWHLVDEQMNTLPPERQPSSIAAATGRSVRDSVLGVFRSDLNDYVWLQINAEPIFKEEVLDLVIVSFNDITARKAAEAEAHKLSQAVHQAGESILITNSEGIIEYVNPAFTSLTGYTPEEAVGEKAIYSDSSKEHSQVFEEIERSVFKGETWKGKVTDKKKSGDEYPTMMTISPIKNDHDEITHFVVFHQDLSELEALEEQFRQAQKMESIGTLVGGIAHDFNNVLAGITGNIYLAKKMASELPDVLVRLTTIEKLSFQSADLIKQLLTFARKGRVDLKEIPLNPFVKETFNFLRASIPENIKMTKNITSDLMIVNGDATQLHQVIMNITNNARDALEKVIDPEINFTLKKFNADDAFVQNHEGSILGPYAHLIIEDNGSGIPKQDLEHLFEPFFTTKEVGKGTGLGLAMVFGAISSHQGIIEVKSEEGKGSNFHVYLPLIEKTQSLSESLNTGTIEGRGETILVVDDNDSVRINNKEILTSLNYKVLEASDGLEAVDVFCRNQNEVRLVVSDLVMPKLGGLDAIRQMKKVHPDLKVIFVTGYDKNEVLEGESDSDSYTVLSKPFSTEDFSRAVRDKLDS